MRGHEVRSRLNRSLVNDSPQDPTVAEYVAIVMAVKGVQRALANSVPATTP